MPTLNEILSAGRYLARQKVPYFRAKILSFVLREAPGLGTIGLSRNGIMRYDPEVVAKWTVPQMAGGYVHEAMHSVLDFWKRIGSRDHHLWNLAQDLSINPMVKETCGPEAMLPTDTMPAMFGFPEGLTADEYYDLLVQSGKGGKPEEGGCGHGKCGGVAGNDQTGEPDEGDADGRSVAEQERINRAVAEEIRDMGGKGAGKAPAGLLRWADTILAPPKVDWRQKLARIARQAVAYRPGCVEHRYDQPGRRQAGLGYGMGVPIMPRFRQPVPRVMVGVDTSGSMGEEEGQAALGEINGIMKATGADVSFSACDSVATAPKIVRTMKDVLALMHGGGGTMMEPLFAAAALARERPEVLVLVTDGGWFDQPTIPPWLRTIIVLVGKHKVVPTFHGEAIVIEVDD